MSDKNVENVCTTSHRKRFQKIVKLEQFTKNIQKLVFITYQGQLHSYYPYKTKPYINLKYTRILILLFCKIDPKNNCQI